MLEYNILWALQPEAGLEHLHLQQNDEGSNIDSVVIGMDHSHPFRISYEIRVDRSWKVQECIIRNLDSAHRSIKLQADGMGHWVDATSASLPALDGCLDVDISVTPFTNTLPIRRLSLQPGQSTDIVVAYITVPDLEVKPAQQRYTCLKSSTNGSLYRYEGVTTGFSREISVDAEGLVIDYPEIWQRISF